MPTSSHPRPIAAIVAVARNGVIGRDGGLPWRLPADLRFFKRQTLEKPVIMGRKTFDSIGKPLPDRLNIVVTRNSEFDAPGVVIADSTDQALDVAASERPEASETMVIGGGQIYRETLDRTTRLYLTDIDAEIEGDTTFPTIDRASWTEIWSEDYAATGSAPAFRWVILERRV